jgi:integrase
MNEFDVRVYKTSTYRGKRGNSYTVRWRVGDCWHRKTFRLSAQANAYRSELRAAARRGEAFDAGSGEPQAWKRQQQQEVTWFDLACRFVDMKWRDVSPRYRIDIARALTAATPAMYITSNSGKPHDKTLRHAMSYYAFNTRQRDQAPDELRQVLRWLAANTAPVARLSSDAELVRALYVAATSRLDGSPAAPDTFRKHKMMVTSVLHYAVELRLMPSNPGTAIRLPVSTAAVEIDLRCVVNHEQARRLLDAVREVKNNGPRLVAFFALMYYAGLRPEEALALRARNVTLPGNGQGWGELTLETADTHTGTAWTNSGNAREERALKHRAHGETRPVPIAPPLVEILRRHLRDFPDGPDGRLFYGIRSGRELDTDVYQRAWTQARHNAFTDAERQSPLAKRPYDLRHACVSTWLAAGVSAPDVAAWAGHSVDVLLRRYAKSIAGQQDIARHRIEQALELDETDR